MLIGEFVCAALHTKFMPNFLKLEEKMDDIPEYKAAFINN